MPLGQFKIPEFIYQGSIIEMYGGGEGGKNFFFKMCALPLSIGAEFYCTTVKDHLIFLLLLYSNGP